MKKGFMHYVGYIYLFFNWAIYLFAGAEFERTVISMFLAVGIMLMSMDGKD